MRVKMLRDYNLDGKLYLEGLEVQVPDEVGERLVKAGAAVAVGSPTLPPAGAEGGGDQEAGS
jgi:hypothetical protein